MFTNIQTTLIYSILFFFFAFSAEASQTSLPEKLMEGNKITSVVVILTVILVGILAFVIVQDRKIKQLEEQIKDE